MDKTISDKAGNEDYLLKIVIIWIYLFAAFAVNAEIKDTPEFRDKFYLAKSLLAKGKTEEALPLYQQLLDEDSTNANLSYLLGVCYTEKLKGTEKSIYHLKQGVDNISLDYDPATHRESSAPVFAWYYLTIAYSQNNRCEEAEAAADKFMSLYGKHKNDFYTRDADKWVGKCMAGNPSQIKKEIVDVRPHILERDVVTKNIEYTTRTPLYAVQIGAYSRLVPIWRFEGLKNVDAFMDNGGMIRYVIGHFTYVSQANMLLKQIWAAGYDDAFIVNINDARKHKTERYSESVVSVDDVSFKAEIMGKVDYRIQLGAFRESIPEELVQLYLKLEGIRESSDKELTILTRGSYPTYEQAATERRILADMGIPRPFIVAYNYNRKVSIAEANNYLQKKSGDNQGD